MNATYLPASSLWVRKSSKIDPTALPLDDQHYTTSGPKKGYVYVCQPRMFRQNAPGAPPGSHGHRHPRRVGSWIDQAAGSFDVTRMIFDSGHVTYSNAHFSATVSGSLRHIVSNGLPVGSFTGVFPVQTTDPAHAYDPNPNPIRTQHISFSIPANPHFDRRIGCVYKEVGITIDGIPLHAPLDSIGNQ